MSSSVPPASSTRISRRNSTRRSRTPSSWCFSQWTRAQNEVVNPPIARTEPTRESILRGATCFSPRTARIVTAGWPGDGESFVKQDVFNDVVFGGNPSERQARIDALDAKTKALWNLKPDSWGNPLRPANLNRGIYKGGRRPIDIYWRIAKGINGAQMPAHYPSPFDEKKMWDVVNFVLALPYEPDLLEDAPRRDAQSRHGGRSVGWSSVVGHWSIVGCGPSRLRVSSIRDRIG